MSEPNLPPLEAPTRALPTMDLPEAPTLPGAAGTAGPAGTRIGEHELLAEIARGAMGVVFRARHASLGRLVALKMILAGEYASAAEVARFQAEALAAAQLDHPHIVPIYEVGEHQGRPFFTMKLFAGSLARAINDPQAALGPKEAARLMEAIARAVHFAHERGILHRDLKPGNILLDETGEPYVSDFGLARRVEGGSRMTQSGAIVGTPAYMPPEQARGEKALTTAADVYSLGAILYELLTGRPPFQAPTAVETVLQVLEKEPASPSRVRPGVDRDLETICLKCLEKDAARRYPSAQALADDLQRWQRGEPIEARRGGAWYRVRKWARRRPGAALLAAATVAVLAGLLTLGGLLWHNAEQRAEAVQSLSEAETRLAQVQARADQLQGDADQLSKELLHFMGSRVKAQKETNQALEKQRQAIADQVKAMSELVELRKERDRVRKEASEARSSTVMTAYLHHVNSAERELRQGNLTDARSLLDECPGPARRWEWYYLKRAVEARLHLLTGHAGRIHALAVSRDGQWLASGGSDKSIQLWRLDGRTAKPTQSLRHEGAVSGLAFLPNGRLASSSHDRTVRLWEVGKPRAVQVLRGHTREVTALAASRDGAMLATASLDGTVRLWDGRTGKPGLVFRDHQEAVLCVTIRPDGGAIASGGDDGKVRVWSSQTGKELFAIDHAAPVFAVAFRPDGKQLASTSSSVLGKVGKLSPGTLRPPPAARWGRPALVLSDATSGAAQRRITTSESMPIQALAYSPDGEQLAETGLYQPVRLWDAASGRAIAALGQGSEGYAGLAFTPDGGRLFASGVEGKKGWFGIWESGGIESWDLRGDWGRQRLDTPTVAACAARPGSTELCIAGVDGRVEMWNVSTGKRVRQLSAFAGWVFDAAYSPDGKWLAVGGEVRVKAATSRIQIYDARTGEEKAALTTRGASLRTLAFDPASKVLLSGGINSKELTRWEVGTWKKLESFQAAGRNVLQARFSPDGKLLAVAANEEGTWLHDARTGKRLRLLWWTTGARAVAFSPNSLEVATATGDHANRTVKLAVHDVTGTFPKHHSDKRGGAVWSVAFSPDGRRLVLGGNTAGGRGQVLLLDVTTTEEALALGGHAATVQRAFFTPDGRRLITAAGGHARAGELFVFDAGRSLPPDGKR